MKRCLLFPVMLILLLQVPAAIAGNLTDDPGYMDLDWITIPDHAATVQDIDLGDILLGIASDSENSGNESLAQALAMIHSVRVKAFSLTPEDVAKAQKAVDKVMDRLKKDNWNRLVFVKDDKETVTVSTKSRDGKMVGLMVVVLDPSDEVMFINVAGDLNLGTLFKLAQHFDVDDLDSLMGNMPQPPDAVAPAPTPDDGDQ